MSSINQHLGDMVRKMREYRELTQKDLADKAGLSRVTIGQIERGNAEPSLGNLHKIASALNCYIDIKFTPVDEA
jgi:XRE family transcriptional regulator, regulator of sulfur utilization